VDRAEVQSGEVGDPVEHGIVDPAAVKKEAVESATEAATMIARIDDVISAE
jgi:chaperonin GroEL (HSP60 family)